MAIDTTPSQVATNALQAIPFGSIKHVSKRKLWLRRHHGSLFKK